jgi:hypothetical protein
MENDMSNGEVLAVVNKHSQLKIQNPHKFPQVSRLLRSFFYTLFVFKDCARTTGHKVEGCKV